MTRATLACVLFCVAPIVGATSARTDVPASRIVFLHERGDGGLRLYATDPLEVSSPLRDLRLGRDHRSPRWSSDGRRLLFIDRFSGTYVVDVSFGTDPPETTRPKRVALGATAVDWAPDGTAITLSIWVGHGHCSDLYVKTFRHRLRPLTFSSACEAHPAWSPDGTRLAFERGTHSSTKIVVSDRDGRRPVAVGEGSFPVWSPDARSVAFLTTDPVTGTDEIDVVDSETGALQRRLEPPAPFSLMRDGLAWSPDGNRFVFGYDDVLDTQNTHLGMIGSDGSGADGLYLGTVFPDTDPDWQPLCTLYGTNGDDVLTGTPGDDVICGLRGNDRLRGLGGHDVLFGGDGDDVLVGGSGPDWLFGAFGNDRLYTRDGEADVVNGGPGNDRSWTDGLDEISDTECLQHG